MITVLTGDNSFEIRQRLLDITKTASSEAESIEGENLSLADLSSLLLGVSLFSQSKVIILKGLSSNSVAWSKLEDYIQKIDQQTELILVEPSLDKRTKTYKELKKHASIEVYESWTYKDSAKAVDWVVKAASDLGLKATKSEAKYLIERVGFNQWKLHSSIEKLALVGSMSKNMVDAIVEEDIHENVFQLLETALTGDANKVIKIIHGLERSEDPYKIFGLMFSQLFQLVALASAPSVDDVIKDLKLHPYAAKKQSSLANKINQHKLHKTIEMFAESDEAIRFARPDAVWAELTRLLVFVCKI